VSGVEKVTPRMKAIGDGHALVNSFTIQHMLVSCLATLCYLYTLFVVECVCVTVRDDVERMGNQSACLV
jgi:hypothetical protein